MRVPKSWGHEEILYAGPPYCLKLLVYERPIASSLHYHCRKHETFYVASGEFEIQYEKDGDKHVLKPGDVVVLPHYTPHRVRCVLAGTIVEASSGEDPEDCVRLIPSES